MDFFQEALEVSGTILPENLKLKFVLILMEEKCRLH